MPTNELRNRALRSKSQVIAAPLTTAHALRALNVAEAIRDEHTKNLENKYLSPAGQADATRKFMAKAALRFSLSQRGIEHERSSLKTERQKLEQRAFEPYRADVWGPQICAAIKDVPHGQAVKLAAEDPRVLAALVMAPRIVHGVAPEALSHLVQAHLQQHHSADLAT
jgi:hypothetical protein